MAADIVSKSVVSVTEMARMVGLSRARFYQLIRRGTFPAADQDAISQRPCYMQEKQLQIIEARRRNCGVDGNPILFYCRRNDAGQKRTPSQKSSGIKKEIVNKYADVIDLLAGANVSASVSQIEPIMKELYPNGTDGIDPGEIIKSVFLRIRCQN